MFHTRSRITAYEKQRSMKKHREGHNFFMKYAIIPIPKAATTNWNSKKSFQIVLQVACNRTHSGIFITDSKSLHSKWNKS